MLRKLSLVALLAGVLLAGGCAGNYSASFTVNGGDRATVIAHGSTPFVEVRNLGPDDVWVDMRLPATGEAQGRALLANNSFGRGTSTGPIEVEITAEPGKSALIDVELQRATGMAVHNQAATGDEDE